jgi:FlaA1/EpsC-like NDP-sugar epimerase
MKPTLLDIDSKLSRRVKQVIFSLIDLVLFGLSIYIAFNLRFDSPEVRLVWMRRCYYLILLVFPIRLAFFWLIGVYRPVLRYMGVEFLMTAIIGVGGSSGLILLAGFLLQLNLFPRSVLILDGIVTLILLIFARISVRWFIYYALVTRKINSNGKEKIIVYGVGEGGSQLVQALSRDSGYKVVAFVDDKPHLIGQVVSGVKVFSDKQLIRLIEKHKVKTVLLTDLKIGKQGKVEIVKKLHKADVSIKTIPKINEIVSGRVSINEIRNIDIIDLLGREEIASLPQLLRKDIRDKVVMVTGAGGSIGSELCRQIVDLRPRRLILYELNEFALYNIHIELSDTYPDIDLIPCLASVLNGVYLERTLKKQRVDTIYHAAAYKHVPLIESNISVGVTNNVKGTLMCVRSAIKCNIGTFVLISTDKAVRPTNVMGATKRIAEMILQGFSDSNPNTRLVIVRFGNVLDSAGSVVPRFRQQIEEGKNLTVTHRDIERFFMSIPEAARLVIQAGAMGEGGDVFLLDMGEPVKIYDLAVQMIELSGLQIGEDIDIEFRGLRPGEKLFEELLIDKDHQHPTAHPKIRKAEEPHNGWISLEAELNDLFKAAEDQNDEKVLERLKRIVPEFKHLGSAN